MLSGVLGVATIAASVASASPPAPGSVKPLSRTAAATATFPSTTSTTTTAPAASTSNAAMPAPTAPPVAGPDDVAAALRYLAASQPAPAPAEPAPAPASGSVEDAIATYFGDVYDKAVRVARCESSLDPNAVSAGGGNYGLFQINKIHQPLVESMGYSWDQILDPYVNAAVARQIYDGSGWSPWGCRYA